MDRHIDCAAPVDDVWPWLVQLGKGRAGWYLPRSAERFVPHARRAARRVEDRWLHLHTGDCVADWGFSDPTFKVLEIHPPHHLVYWSERPRRPRRGVARPPLRMTWTLALSPDGPRRSHLQLRLRLDLGKPAGPVATYGGGAVDWLTVWLMGIGLNERLNA